jgi:hypothetical protein
VPGGRGPGWPAPDQQRQRPRGPADCSTIRAPSTCARSTCSPTWTAGSPACSTPQPSMSPSMRSSPPARTPAALPRLAQGRADAGRLPAPARPLPSGAGRRSNLTSSRYGQAGRLPVARSFERHPRAGNRSERTITTDLIGLRQADTSQVPPGRARYGLPRPTLSRVRRTVRPCCARGPLYGSATGREVRRPGAEAEGAHGATVKARIAVRTRSFKSNPIEKPTPRWQVVGQPVAGACRSRADPAPLHQAMTSGNAGHLRVRGA